jgi:hypothetical protein
VTQLRIFSPSKKITSLDRQVQRHLMPLREVLPATAAAALATAIDYDVVYGSHWKKPCASQSC